MHFGERGGVSAPVFWGARFKRAATTPGANATGLALPTYFIDQQGETMADQALDRELKNALTQIEKQFGKGAIMQLGESSALDVQGISTGALSLDIALGGRGLPRGRIIEIFGPESSGKTTVALHAVGSAQKQGGVAAFIDAEHALDPGWARRVGVDLESLLVSQPSSAEEALKIAEMLIKSNAVDIIVIDSVAALVPRSEVEGEIGDQHVGLQARLMSQALRILNPTISRTKTCMVFINQIRQKIGVMFGNPETTSGGLALKFYSSVRLDIRKVTSVKDGDETVGSRVKVRVVKNKVAPPFKQAEFDLMHDHGISREGDLLDLGLEDKIIDKSGAWISYGEIRLGQGRENAKQYLRDNPVLVEEITRKVLEKRGLAGGPAPAAVEGNGEAVPAAKPEPARKEASGRRTATVAE
jgi:recombination protein RecA